MRKIIPSLLWFSALAGPAWAGNVATDSCGSPPAKAAGSAGDTVVYMNRDYGFSFSLPQSWKGFSVLACRWSGGNAGNHDEEVTGPLLVIRHPLYTEEDPREDIPILVFTRREWVDVTHAQLIVSAAPIPPAEIGRNRRYVFATPPRFSFDELKGVEEVLIILQGKPLRALQSARAASGTRANR